MGQATVMNPFVLSSPTSERTMTDALQQVMIVEDHEIFRRGLRDLINTIEGYQVVAEVSSCEAMLAQIAQMHINLIMLDMYLPDGDGIQAIRQVRQQAARPPRVIILSAIMYPDTLVDAILAGADGYLTKDMPEGAIVRALQGFLRGELALSLKAATQLVHLLVHRYTELEAEARSSSPNGHMSTTLSPAPTEEPNKAASSSSVFFPTLTPQEANILQLLRQGQSNKQIATRLSISPYTVGKHVQHILRKLGVANRTQAASYTSFEGGTEPKG
jgi:DNA-binding NarL/FixJ family response regulator